MKNKKTDFLITGSQKPTTRKINEARDLNIKILSEDDWNKMSEMISQASMKRQIS